MGKKKFIAGNRNHSKSTHECRPPSKPIQNADHQSPLKGRRRFTGCTTRRKLGSLQLVDNAPVASRTRGQAAKRKRQENQDENKQETPQNFNKKRKTANKIHQMSQNIKHDKNDSLHLIATKTTKTQTTTTHTATVKAEPPDESLPDLQQNKRRSLPRRTVEQSKRTRCMLPGYQEARVPKDETTQRRPTSLCVTPLENL